MKLWETETYSETIENLIEDRLVYNPKFIREVEARRKEHLTAKTISLKKLKIDNRENIYSP